MAEEDQLAQLLVKSFFTQTSLDSMLEERMGKLGKPAEGIDFRSLPEYQPLVDAFKLYGDAMAVKYLEVKRKNGVN